MTDITQIISEFGDLPDIADPSTFETRMNALITAMLPLLRTEINTWAGQANTMSAELAALAEISALLVGPGGSVTATRAALGATATGEAVFTAATPAAARIAVDADAPAFSAVPSAATSLTSAVATKVTFGSEQWDTEGCYDAATSRFTPNKAGIYRIGASVRLTNTATMNTYVYKNGVQHKEIGTTAQTSTQQSSGWVEVEANGSTDYFEIYVTQSAATQNSSTSAVSTWFQGSLVRAA